MFLGLLDPDLDQLVRGTDPDTAPDPGGPKTYGSNGSGFGSATLLVNMDE